MSKHLQEPLEYYDKGQQIRDANGDVIVEGRQLTVDECNAFRRIAVCVNFCQHMSSEELEQLTAKALNVPGDEA